VFARPDPVAGPLANPDGRPQDSRANPRARIPRALIPRALIVGAPIARSADRPCPIPDL
jgi:hypothetical protein